MYLDRKLLLWLNNMIGRYYLERQNYNIIIITIIVCMLNKIIVLKKEDENDG